MSSTGSVTHWLRQLRQGDQAAAQPLWEAYFKRLVERARRRLAGRPRPAADEEDVVLSAFDSFCRGAEQGRFPRLDDRQDLWRLLVVITDRKAWKLVNRQPGPQSGGGKVLDQAALEGGDSAREGGGLDQLEGREREPWRDLVVEEEFRRLMEDLGDDQLRTIALLKMESHTVQEIAAKLGCAPRTIDRRLGLIRSIWKKAGHD
jgi:DNA-directed RNA polymerase specialized sigma24 family protein